MLLKMKLVLLLFMLSSVSFGEMAHGGEDDDDLELEGQVNLMNRPPVKTFVTEEGDTVDCVDINKQPALDHPLLKNHRVQTKPNLHYASFERTSPRAKPKYGFGKPCPVGTVPIPTVTKEVLVRARSLPKMPSVVATGPDSPPSNQHAVFIRDDMVKNIKYGGGGGTTLYNLTVARDQCSFHNIWIETGPSNHISMIVAGWSVCPRLGGDALPRLFTYWTGDGFRNGCYNVLCPGFVQVHRTITTNFPLQPASVYGGQQSELIMYIQQDMSTGNWWLNVFYPPIPVGYWPKELFLNLRNGSLHVAWGGNGLAGSDGVCPPMGSGHKPDGNYTHAACFRGLHWTSSSGKFYTPRKEVEWVDRSNVYDLKNDYYQEKMGYTITYGGPGGYCRG